MSKTKQWVLGICFVGSVVFNWASCLVSDRTCADGWDSPSIGIQGACSHHGGVSFVMNHFTLALLSSVLCAAFFVLLARWAWPK